MKDKSCIGCRHGYLFCVIRNYEFEIRCPCVLCLVKPMCNISCDFRHKVITDWVSKRIEKFGG